MTPTTSDHRDEERAASTTNTGQTSPAIAATTPVTAAPMTLATIRVAWPSEFAASRPSAGTTRGSIAIRAGAKKVPMIAWRQASTNSAGIASSRATSEHPEDDDAPAGCPTRA